MNQLQFIGHLGRDPEQRFTPSGQAVTNFSVAVSEKYITSNGEQVKKTTWFRVTTWGKLAENCNQYLRKGSKVFVSGKLNADENGNPRIWKKQDGESGANFEVTAHTVEFLSSRQSGETESQAAETDAPF